MPESTGTLKTYQPLFVGMFVGVTLIVVALTYLPALALGPLGRGTPLVTPTRQDLFSAKDL